MNDDPPQMKSGRELWDEVNRQAALSQSPGVKKRLRAAAADAGRLALVLIVAIAGGAMIGFIIKWLFPH